MTLSSSNDGHSTGEVCPACGCEVVMLLSTDLEAALVECDCGTAAILTAA